MSTATLQKSQVEEQGGVYKISVWLGIWRYLVGFLVGVLITLTITILVGWLIDTSTPNTGWLNRAYYGYLVGCQNK